MNTTQQQFNTAQTSGAQAVIGVFRCRQGHDVPDQEPIPGLTAKYPRDQGLAKDPNVDFFTDFEADSWRDEWSQVANRNASDPVAADPAWNDGGLRAWGDGQVAFEQIDIRFCSVPKGHNKPAQGRAEQR
jgi:hypothetical protein